MPIYRFRIESPLAAQAAVARIRALTREPAGFRQSVRESFAQGRAGTVPFIGRVDGSDFHLHRDIRYRNSFLPQVKGHVEAIAAGTRIDVTMRLHPMVSAFMVFWFGGVCLSGWALLAKGSTEAGSILIPVGMLMFGVALTLGGFYPEAFKARRLLERGVGTTGE